MTTIAAGLSAEVATLVQEVFARQGLMRAWDARLTKLGPGTCEVAIPMTSQVTQQHGFFHGGVISALADVAGGFAANTVLLPTHECLSVEFKVNIMSPGIGQELIGRGKVTKAGKTLVVTTAELFVVNEGVEKLCAIMQQTLFAIEKK